MSDLDLNSIGLSHQTDKASTHHDFLQLYERFIGHLRHEPITLLEIGIFGGGSIRMWADFFRNAKIIGIDIDPTTVKHQTDRIAIELVDQSNIEDLHNLSKKHGPFDIIIDDGSHIWDHQITALQQLLPHLKRGGFYILEDLDTSYGTFQPHYRGRSSISAAQYLQRMADMMIGDRVIDLNLEPDAFIRSYSRRLEYILFARRTSIIRRHQNL